VGSSSVRQLGEGFEFAERREVEPQTTGDLLHRLDLGRAAHARHRDTDVHSRLDAGWKNRFGSR
jgi:hypothetical protein